MGFAKRSQIGVNRFDFFGLADIFLSLPDLPIMLRIGLIDETADVSV
jgi:hypothetical protein